MVRLSAVGILAVGLLACGDEVGRIDVSVATAPLVAQASDGSTGSLQVTIRAVRVHVGADDADEVTGTDGGVVEDVDGDGWATVFEGAAILDLADADATALFLGGAEVPAGPITQIRLVLDGAPSYISGDQSHEVSCPSCTTSGLKIVTRGSLVLGDGEHLALDLAFDPATTLELTPAGYRMAPVVKLDKVREVVAPE
jgi:hypothetical protein